MLALVGLTALAWMASRRESRRLENDLQRLALHAGPSDASAPGPAVSDAAFRVEEMARLGEALERAQASARERQQAERDRAVAEERAAAQAEAHRRLRLALDAGRMGSFTLCVATRRLRPDANFRKLFGLSAEQEEMSIDEIGARVQRQRQQK